MTEQHIFTIRKELRGLKQVEALATLCNAENIASRGVVYDAITPDSFSRENALHRLVVRRAVRLVQSFGCLTDWDIDILLPESLEMAAAA